MPDEHQEPERGPVAQLARLFLVQLAAVIGIAAAIVVVVALVGPDGDDDISAVGPSTSPSVPEESTTPAPTTSSAPAETTTSAPPTSTTAAPSPSGFPDAVPVDVLNQSAPNGSAENVAQRLEAAGWEIGRIDDFRGNVSTTTVYYLDEDQKRQARQVARFLGGVRVQEGFDTLVDDRVSVVLVDTT